MRKSNQKYIIWAIVFLVVWYYIKIANAAVNLGFSKGAMSGFKVDFKNDYVTWLQGINIINGAGVGIPIRTASVLVSTGATEIGYTMLEQPFMIAARGISEMKLRVIIPIQNIISLGTSLFTQIQQGKISARMSGTINSVGVTYPLNETYQLDWSKDKK